MQRRDSLGISTKIPRLSKGSTRKFKTRRSHSSFSSASDVFAETESTKGQPDLSVSGMKLRSEKNLDGDQGRSAEAGPASETLVDPFDEGERTLILPDFEPSEDLEREEVERTDETSERSEVEPREEVLFKGMSKSETKSHRWRRENSHSANTHSSLEKRLDAKSDLMMRKLDAILNGSNWEERSNPRERSRHANDGDGTGSYARAQQSSRTNYEPRNRERPRAAPSRPGWTNLVPPEADATPETRLPTVPQVSSVPDLTTVSQDTTMYALMFEPLNRSLETFITKLSKSTERGERSRRTLKKPKSYKDESDGCIDTWIEVMKLHFEEESLSKKQECSALTSNLEGTALNCVMTKSANERDSARKIFDILLNRFGSGVQGHQLW